MGGAWSLYVVALDNEGACAIEEGDELYANPDTLVISKKTTGEPLGYALSAVPAGLPGKCTCLLRDFNHASVRHNQVCSGVLLFNDMDF